MANGSVYYDKNKKKYVARLPREKRINQNGDLYYMKRFVGYFDSREEAEISLGNALKTNIPGITVLEVLDGYLKKNKEVIQGTNKKELIYSIKLLNNCLNRSYIFTDITSEQLLKWINSQDTFSKQKKVKTLLSKLYEYSICIGLCKNNPARNLRYNKKNNSINNGTFNLEELTKIFSIEEKELDKFGHPVDEPLKFDAKGRKIRRRRRNPNNTETKYYKVCSDILRIIYETGVSIYKLLEVKKEDIVFNEMRFKVPSQKKIQEYVDYNDDVAIILEKYVGKSEYLFSNHLGEKLEYSVFRRYYFNKLMVFLKIEKHNISDMERTHYDKNK